MGSLIIFLIRLLVTLAFLFIFTLLGIPALVVACVALAATVVTED